MVQKYYKKLTIIFGNTENISYLYKVNNLKQIKNNKL